jgi:hypothetical protein
MVYRASVAASGIPQMSVPSKSRVDALSLIGLVAVPGDLSGSCVATGQAASTPATFADLAHTHVVQLQDCPSVIFHAGNTAEVRVTSGFDPGIVVGDTCWVCYVNSTGSPSSGTALDQVANVGAAVD